MKLVIGFAYYSNYFNEYVVFALFIDFDHRLFGFSSFYLASKLELQ